MSERDALKGRIETLRKTVRQNRGLAEALRTNLRQKELSIIGEVDLINTTTLSDTINILCETIDELRKGQNEIDRLEEELDG